MNSLFNTVSRIIGEDRDNIEAISGGLRLEDGIHIDMIFGKNAELISEDAYYAKLLAHPDVEKVIESEDITICSILFVIKLESCLLNLGNLKITLKS